MRHNKNNDIIHVEVEPQTEAMKMCYGASYFLEEHKAMELQRDGVVKIIDKEYLNLSYAFVDVQAQQLSIEQRSSFMQSRRKMKIAWVQDQSSLGGAELSNIGVIKAGLDCGFDIVQVTPKRFNKNILLNSDIIILNNIFEFDVDQFADILSALFFFAKPYIKYDHDLRELKRLNITRRVFERSLFNVFISPAHYEAYADVYGERLIDRSKILPLSIDTDLFRLRDDLERKPKSAIIPTFAKNHEGHTAFMREHRDWTFTVMKTPHKFTDANVSQINSAPIERMAELYSKHEYMVHLPLSRGAGERVYFEAMMCGCKPIVNKNVSHESWNVEPPHATYEEVKDMLTLAPYTFWKEVDERAKDHCLL